MDTIVFSTVEYCNFQKNWKWENIANSSFEPKL